MKTVSELEIRAANGEDLNGVLALLGANGLPVEGVADHLKTFIVARDGDQLVGCSGAEAYSFVALVRSIAVDETYRGIGLGRRLTREILDRLSSRGVREFYLLTNDAEEYFKKRGFKTIDRDEVHPQVLASSEFNGVCEDTAVCMRLVMT